MSSRPTSFGRSSFSSARSSRPPPSGFISLRRRSMGNGTRLGRVRGLGSSHHGSHHWLPQRFTALGNVLLVGFLFVSFMPLPMTAHCPALPLASNPMSPPALLLSLPP